MAIVKVEETVRFSAGDSEAIVKIRKFQSASWYLDSSRALCRSFTDFGQACVFLDQLQTSVNEYRAVLAKAEETMSGGPATQGH